MFNIKSNFIAAALIALGSYLALMPEAILARDKQSSPCQFAPREWAPSLSQVADTLDGFATNESQPSQQTLNLMSQNVADVKDAELFITYVQLAQSLNAQEQRKLCAEQQRWLDKRAASASASVSSKGGSLAPMEYSGTFRKITEARLAELQKRLQQPSNVVKPKSKK